MQVKIELYKNEDTHHLESKNITKSHYHIQISVLPNEYVMCTSNGFKT